MCFLSHRLFSPSSLPCDPHSLLVSPVYIYLSLYTYTPSECWSFSVPISLYARLLRNCWRHPLFWPLIVAFPFWICLPFCLCLWPFISVSQWQFSPAPWYLCTSAFWFWLLIGFWLSFCPLSLYCNFLITWLPNFGTLKTTFTVYVYRRHKVWHLGLQPVIIPWSQSTSGLCVHIQGLPRTRGTGGELITKKTISSWWLPEMRILTGTVARQTSSNRMPVMAQGRSGSVSGTVGISMRLTRVGEMKLASDPKSRSTGTWTWVPSQETPAVIAGLEPEGGELVVMPVRIPSLTDKRCLLTDRLIVDVLSPPKDIY